MVLFNSLYTISKLQSGVTLRQVRLGVGNEQQDGSVLCNVLGVGAIDSDAFDGASDADIVEILKSCNGKNWDDLTAEEQAVVTSAQISVRIWPESRSGKLNPLFDEIEDAGLEGVLVDISRLVAQERIDDTGLVVGWRYRATGIKLAETPAATDADVSLSSTSARVATKSRQKIALGGTLGAKTVKMPPAPPAASGLIPAAGIDLAAYRAAGWSDDQLVANNLATKPAVAPPPPAPAAAVPPPPAPMGRTRRS